MHPLRAFVIAVSALCSAAAFAGQPCIAIDHVPFIAWTSGTYCAVNDLTFGNAEATAAIEIRADNVTIDLQGYAMRSSPDINSYAIVATKWWFEKVIIRNGRIDGFAFGVLAFANDLVVQDLVINDVLTGIEINGYGVDIDNVVTRGRMNTSVLGVIANGGTWEVSRLRVEGGFQTAIDSAAEHIDIRDSYLAGRFNAATLKGAATTLRDSDLRVLGDLGKDVVICTDKSTSLITGNTFSGASATVNAINNAGSGKYRDNTALGDLKYVGGTDAGGNV